MESLFRDYWWLLFPIFGMAMGFFSIFSYFNHKNETLKMIKSFADKGQEPPAALLEHLKEDDYRGRGYYSHRHRNPYSSIFVFGGLAAGFGYFGYVNGHTVFTALAIGFGIAAAGSLIMALLMPRHKD